MKEITGKKHRISPLAICLIIALGIAVAAVYIALQFNIIMNVQPYPKVAFWEWSTSQKKTTFDYSVNIFAGIKTVDENITHGIFNDDSSHHQCALRIKSLNSVNIERLNITLYDGTNTILTKEWTEFETLPTQWENFIASANSKYAIWIEITATGSPSGSSTFEIEIKENNP